MDCLEDRLAHQEAAEYNHFRKQNCGFGFYFKIELLLMVLQLKNCPSADKVYEILSNQCAQGKDWLGHSRFGKKTLSRK